MVRAFLLSFVTRQYLLLRERVSERYPHDWLVWEPGIWSAVSSNKGEDLAATRLPASAAGERPPKGDALCYLLPRTQGQPTSIDIGRANTNQLVINDATVSRSHLLLKAEKEGPWLAEVALASRATEYRSRSLSPGDSVMLRSGDQLKIGDVLLTYYDPAGFLQRLAAESKKLST